MQTGSYLETLTLKYLLCVERGKEFQILFSFCLKIRNLTTFARQKTVTFQTKILAPFIINDPILKIYFNC